jgi:hypothetical protein
MRAPALVLAMALAAVAACGDSPTTDADVDWGPLAVARGDASGDEALLEGTLRIDDECVTVETSGEVVLVVWPGDSTRWDAVAETITYGATDDGAEVVLRSGDEMHVGGGGWSADEFEGDPAEWAGSTDWLNQPADDCLTGVRFFLGTLSN